MSRQNRNQVRDQKRVESKRDVSNNSERPLRQQKEDNRSGNRRMDLNDMHGFDRYRLNDLYERSSI